MQGDWEREEAEAEAKALNPRIGRDWERSGEGRTTSDACEEIGKERRRQRRH